MLDKFFPKYANFIDGLTEAISVWDDQSNLDKLQWAEDLGYFLTERNERASSMNNSGLDLLFMLDENLLELKNDIKEYMGFDIGAILVG